MKKVTLILAAIIFSVVSGLAQDTDVANHNLSISIPDFAILDIESSEGGTSIDLSPSVEGLEAGAQVNFTGTTNSNLWLNYTAITNQVGGGNSPFETRKITVSISDVIDGVDINLLVDDAVENGDGIVGTPVEEDAVTLTTTAQSIVTGIESCYTGDGAGSGHQLTYSLDATDYDVILSETHNLVVTYTIADE